MALRVGVVGNKCISRKNSLRRKKENTYAEAQMWTRKIGALKTKNCDQASKENGMS